MLNDNDDDDSVVVVVVGVYRISCLDLSLDHSIRVERVCQIRASFIGPKILG